MDDVDATPAPPPPPPPPSGSAAELILAQACENENHNAKRLRMGLEPVSQPLPMVGGLFQNFDPHTCRWNVGFESALVDGGGFSFETKSSRSGRRWNEPSATTASLLRRLGRRPPRPRRRRRRRRPRPTCSGRLSGRTNVPARRRRRSTTTTTTAVSLAADGVGVGPVVHSFCSGTQEPPI